MFAFCVCGLEAVFSQVLCVDAAREAARLAARGADNVAVGVARRVGPVGATVDLRREGDFVVARVHAPVRFLPGLQVAAEAVAALESG